MLVLTVGLNLAAWPQVADSNVALFRLVFTVFLLETTIWVVVNIMVPFGVLGILRHLEYRGPKTRGP